MSVKQLKWQGEIWRKYSWRVVILENTDIWTADRMWILLLLFWKPQRMKRTSGWRLAQLSKESKAVVMHEVNKVLAAGHVQTVVLWKNKYLDKTVEHQEHRPLLPSLILRNTVNTSTSTFMFYLSISISDCLKSGRWAARHDFDTWRIAM